MLHEQMAVQMLDLVAETAGGQTLVLHLKPVAVAILSADADDLRPRDLAVFPGNTEAALQAGLLTLSTDDLRIHQLDELILLVQHHAHAAQHAYLRGGQAHAAGVLQRVSQIIQQHVQAVIELRHRTAHLGQAGFAL